MNSNRPVVPLLSGVLALLFAQSALALPYVVQRHYRWRNDDGNELTATWKGPADLPTARLVKGERIRLRFSLENTSPDGTFDQLAPRLEYSSFATGPFRQVPISTTLEPFEMAHATGYSDGGSTTALLDGTLPSYVTGKVVESPNNTPVPHFALPPQYYSNFEYCFQATERAVGGAHYYFRLRNLYVHGSSPQFDYHEYASDAELVVVDRALISNGSGATDITPISAVLNGEVVNDGGEQPSITMHWGTTDGGTNPLAWDHTIELGIKPGMFSHVVTGFVANSSLYYSCSASNLAGSSWASAPVHFMTAAPSLDFTNGHTEVEEGPTSVVLNVAMELLSAEPVSVCYATSNGTAEAGADYVSTTGILTWAALENGVRAIKVPILDDDSDEPEETFMIMLSCESNCVVVNGNALVRIVDNDGLPSVQFAQPTSKGGEETSSVMIRITLVPPSQMDVSVAYAVTGATASSNDYSVTGNVAELPAGTNGAWITLGVVDDDRYESDETITLTLSSPSNALLGFVTNHTFTILDSDPRPPQVDNWIGAASIFATSASLRGQVLDTGRDDPSVRIYWGPVDGNTDTNLWAHSIPMGPAGVATFAAGVSNLVTGILYYYRCFGANVAGSAWAPSSENFIAEDPPSFQLLRNESIEAAGGEPGGAAHWYRVPTSGSASERVNEFPRTGSYSLALKKEGGVAFIGINSNAFRVTWNGQYAGAGGPEHAGGGIRPGFVVSGNAYVRARAFGMDPSSFSYAWYNATDDTTPLLAQIVTESTVYQPMPIGPSAPVPVWNLNDVFVPAFQRDTVGTTDEDRFHLDDVSVEVSLPRLFLEQDPATPVVFPPVYEGRIAQVRLGARNQGGGPGTVLYGAYIPQGQPERLTDRGWDHTAWFESYDPDDAFGLVAGTELVAPADEGFQYVTIVFQPAVAGSFTGVVRVATTDPNDHYTAYVGGGLLHRSIVYEQYILTGTSLPLPELHAESFHIREGHTGETAIPCRIMLTAPMIEDVTVSYATVDGTATAGEDYVATSGFVTIPAGVSATSVLVRVLGDIRSENRETFFMMLSNPSSNARLAPSPHALFSIADDDHTMLIIR